MTLDRRQIDLEFQIGQGSFGESGVNTLKLHGLRVTCNISKIAGPGSAQANLRVYGLTASHLAQLSALNKAVMMVRKNKIIVTAGVAGNMGKIFEGQIAVGQIDMSDPPDSSLVILAYSGLLEALAAAPPTSYPQSADVATIMGYLADQMGLQFENNLPVPILLSTPYFPGTLRDQAMRCADAAGINWLIDNGILAIWPRYGSRNGQFPLISPKTGMIGYPAYSEMGISVVTMFNPFLKLGETVVVKSSLGYANGKWIMFNLQHNLESELPGGEWFTKFTGFPVNAAPSTQ